MKQEENSELSDSLISETKSKSHLSNLKKEMDRQNLNESKQSFNKNTITNITNLGGDRDSYNSSDSLNNFKKVHDKIQSPRQDKQQNFNSNNKSNKSKEIPQISNFFLLPFSF